MKQLRLFLAAMVVSATAFAQPTITGPSTMCVGSSVTLAGSPSGGTWASTPSTVAVVGSSSGIVTGIAAGVAVITYMGGGALATYNVTVNPVPPPITGPASTGTGGTVTLMDAAPGGMWSSSSSGVATINPATGVVTGVSIGTCTISYCLATGCCATITFTVSAALQVAPHLASASGAPAIAIYPNPAKVNPNLQWENQSIGYATVTISNIVGREVYKSVVSINSSNGNTPLDLSSLKDGIYILNVKSSDINYTTRLILQK